MRAGAIVIFHVRQQQVTEMALAEHNTVVDAFPSDRTDQPFVISVLPWGTRPRRLIAHERLPPLGRRISLLGHIFSHARLSDRDVELEQLSMDPWRSPQWVSDAHLADQPAYFPRNCWPATTRSRLPAPVQTEAGTVPLDSGPGPNNGNAT